jgi:hypothetical protein
MLRGLQHLLFTTMWASTPSQASKGRIIILALIKKKMQDRSVRMCRYAYAYTDKKGTRERQAPAMQVLSENKQFYYLDTRFF